MHDCAAVDAELRRLRREVEELRAAKARLEVRLAEVEASLRMPGPRHGPSRSAGGQGGGSPVPGRAMGPTTVRPRRWRSMGRRSWPSAPAAPRPWAPPWGVRERVVEEIVPARLRATRYRVHRYWCPRCRARVEAQPEGVLPGQHFGLRLMLLVCYLRTLGLTWGKVQAYLGEAFGIRVSHGGLVHMEAAVAGALGPLYRRLLEEVRRAKAVHADDTSWRIDGEDHWPWILLAKGVSYYAVRDTRGRRVVEEALGPGYGGVVVSDFYPTLAGLPYGQQKCLVHLLREIKRFEGRPDFRPGREWRRVRMRVKRLVTEAVEGRELEDPGGRRALKERLVARAAAVARLPRGHRYARTLARLVGRYRESLFTFLDHGEVSWENNPAERALRPMVVNRKTSYGSRSTARAGRRCVLQSVAETARLRGESFFDLAGGELGPGPPRPIPGL